MPNKYIIANKEINKTSTSPNIVDKFRQTFGFFNTDEGLLGYVQKDPQDYSLENLQNLNGISPYENHSIVVDTINNGSTIILENLYRDSYYYIINKNSSLNPENYLTFNKRYDNFCSSFEVPISSQETRDIDKRISNTYPDHSVNIEFVYSAERPVYENYSKSINAEIGLLNFYEGIENINQGNTKPAEQMLKESIDSYKFSKDKRSKFKNLIFPSDNENFLLNSNKIMDSFNNLQSKVRDVLSTHVNLDPTINNLSLEETYITGIPYFAKIQIDPSSYQNSNTTQQNGKFLIDNFLTIKQETSEKSSVDILDLNCLLARWHIENKSIINTKDELVYSRMYDPRSNKPSSIPQDQNLSQFYTYELYEWINELAPTYPGNLPPDIKFIGPSTLGTTVATSDSTNAGVFLSIALVNFLNGLAPTPSGFIDLTTETYDNFYKYFYDYKKMLECGGFGVNETLFYRIDKFAGGTTNGSPVQTILIPNNSSQKIEYYDTQIFYNKQYTYRISEVKAVLGCEYEYVKVEQKAEDLENNKYVVRVRQYPRIKIIEIPVFDKSLHTIAYPPLVPDFEVVPVRRTKNSVRFNFKSNYGIQNQKFISLSDQDDLSVNKILSNQMFKMDEFEFNDISSVSGYEVYYSLIKPVNNENIYKTFKNNLLFTVNTDISNTTPQSADSATAQINFPTNIKHYICFVARNKLGLSSRPSQIYELELVYDGGYSYLILKEYDYYKEYKQKFLKPKEILSRSMIVRPTAFQSFVNYQKSNLISIDPDTDSVIYLDSKNKTLILGNAVEDYLFPPGSPNASINTALGKKIKLRIRSKASSRMIDINLHFKHERLQSDFEKTPTQAIISNLSGENDNFGTSGNNGANNFIKPKKIPLSCISDNPSVLFHYPEPGVELGDPVGGPARPIEPPPITGPPGVPLPIPPGLGGSLIFDPTNPNQRPDIQSPTNSGNTNGSSGNSNGPLSPGGGFGGGQGY